MTLIRIFMSGYSGGFSVDQLTSICLSEATDNNTNTKCQIAPCARELFDRAMRCSPRETASDAASAQPESIGSFRILDVLGEGGQSVVYRGYDRVLKREVAIKLRRAPMSIPANEDCPAKEMREAVIQASLASIYLPDVYEVGVHDGRVFLVMEFVTGMSLRKLRTSRVLNESEIRRIVGQLALAVADTHSKGIVHLDLKPENVLIDQQGNIKLIDFGLARRAGQTQYGNELIGGTPGFIAPEVLIDPLGAAHVTADVYGLGAVLFYLMTGSAPISDRADAGGLLQGNESMLIKLQRCRYSRRLKSVCKKAMHRLPGRRFPSGVMLKQALTCPAFSGRLYSWSRKAAYGILLTCMASIVIGSGFYFPLQSTSAADKVDRLHDMCHLTHDSRLRLRATIPHLSQMRVSIWTPSGHCLPVEMGAFVERLEHGDDQCAIFGTEGIGISAKVGPIMAVIVQRPHDSTDINSSDFDGESIRRIFGAMDFEHWESAPESARVSVKPGNYSLPPTPLLSACHRRDLSVIGMRMQAEGIVGEVVIVPIPRCSTHVPLFDVALDFTGQP